MDSPYRIDPEALANKQRAAQQEKLITLKDDSARPPSTIGTSPLQGILMGPAAGQPSNAVGEVKPGWGKILLRILFWIWAMAMCTSVIYRIIH
jgi:hypothetical protein